MTPELYPLFMGYSVVFGLIFGSFANAAIARLAEGRTMLTRSSCPACQAQIAAYDNVPVLSWLWLRGRCRACGSPISPAYPTIELIGGALGWLCFVRFMPDAASLSVTNLFAWAILFALSIALLIASMVDIRHRIIPDETSIYAVPVWIAALALLSQLGPAPFPLVGLRESVLGALAGGGFLAVIALGGEALAGREVLGWGDVKLMAGIGAVFGPIPGAFLVLLLASGGASVAGLLALIGTGERRYLPLGPALALAAIVYGLYGDALIPSFFPGMQLFMAP